MSLIVLKAAIDLAGLVAALVGLASSLVFRAAVLSHRGRPEHCRFPRVEYTVPVLEPDHTPDRQAAGIRTVANPNGQYI
jgi:hypothetical protein